jgi:hypothetical protein
MSTIVEVVKTYMREHPHIRIFEFTGEPTEKEDQNTASKRLNLYTRYLRSIFDNHWEFRPTGNHMMIVRKD